MDIKNPVNMVALLLVIVGALNWGLVGAFDFNLVDELFGVESALSSIIYILVGVSGLYLAVVALMRGTAQANDA